MNNRSLFTLNAPLSKVKDIQFFPTQQYKKLFSFKKARNLLHKFILCSNFQRMKMLAIAKIEQPYIFIV